MARLLLSLALLIATPVQAQLCDGSNVGFGGDGRALGHLPYGDAPPGDLVAVPAEYATGGCMLRREMLPDLARLLAAAAGDPAVGGRILALSCHRSLGYQQSVFCRERQTAAGDRAISVAPPGHSEHATGYALDFAVRPRVNGCPDAEACIAATAGFRWLAADPAPPLPGRSGGAGSRVGQADSFAAVSAMRLPW